MRAATNVSARCIMLCFLLQGCAAGEPPAGALAPSQPTAGNKALAQADFDEASRAWEKGDYARACDKLESSNSLDPSKVTTFQLAECYEKTGRLASAYDTFLDAGEMAKKDGLQDAANEAIARADRIFPLLKTRLQIDPATPSQGEDLVVRRDGRLVARAQLSRAVPVDPGTHTITAVSRGKKPWSASRNVVEGTTERVAIPRMEERSPSPQKILGAIGLGIGGAAGVAVVVLGSLRVARKNELTTLCGDNLQRCPGGILGGQSKPADLRKEADQFADGTNAAAAVGAAGIAAGIGLLLWARAAESGTGVELAPVVGPTVGGLEVRTRF